MTIAKNSSSVNDENYWDNRFKDNWDDKSGDKQSVFFMGLAMEMFPNWLTEILSTEKKTVCDWGCAEGDGTNILAESYPKSVFNGIDFSDTAIANANKRYKRANLSYEAVDILTQPHEKKYDIVFSSNVFEHFHEPWKVFDKVSDFATELVVMMVPFNEDKDNLHFEHFHSFSTDQFKLVNKDWDIIHFKVKDTSALPVSYWMGFQGMVIFARKGTKLSQRLSFKDIELTADKMLPLEKKNRTLAEENVGYENEITSLADQLIEYEEIIAELKSNKYDESLISPISDSKIRKLFTSRLVNNKFSRHPLKIARRLKARRERADVKNMADLVRQSEFFDSDYYLSKNPDVAAHNIDPVEHYLRHGLSERREPSQHFDQAYYTARYRDIERSGINPLIHYLLMGKAEGRYVTPTHKIGFNDRRYAIAFQLDSFDRGGLEEVVLMLGSNPQINKKYRVYIFVSGFESGYLAKIAEDRGVNVIFLEDNPKYLKYLITHLHVKLVNLHYSTFGLNVYKKSKVRTVYTVHNNYIWSDDSFVSSRMNELKKVDHFVAVSDQVGNYFSKKFNIKASKIDTVTNGIEIAENNVIKKTTRESYGLLKNDFVFINVASFTVNKFHALSIAAMGEVVKAHPEAKLLLVGNVINQKYFSDMKMLIKKYGVEKNVQILDYVPKADLLGLLDISDCFLMPSLTEGFSISTIEAMYHKLPLILSDVGGARHAIKNGDIGIIIRNPYDDIQGLTSHMIETRYVDDSHLANLDELITAMREMLEHKSDWKRRGVEGRRKVEDNFQATHVVAGYLREFDEQLYGKVTVSELLPAGAEIAFVAPYPTKGRVTEGWMSRINTVDSIIGSRPKVYLNISEGSEPLQVLKHEAHGWEIIIGRQSLYYLEVMDLIVQSVNLVYVHTLHLAEYIIPWLDSGKVTVDFHGITPEEEVMMGRSFLKEKYEDIEQRVLDGARACVMVTEAMIDHYAAKYAIRPKNIVILPIVEELKKSSKRTFHGTGVHEIVYSGGTQAWQNVDAMMTLADVVPSDMSMTFLSHDWESLKRIGEARGVENVSYEFCKKSELHNRYKDFDFGLVLRDDTPVNRVACPTKLYEYMKSGIIPIVRSEKMGDFIKFGYGYITEEDFKAGKLPTEEQMTDMMRKNYQAADKMEQAFTNGRNILRKMVK